MNTLGKGRTMLLAFGFLLVLQGPLQNFVTNTQRTTDTITCGQEVAHNVTKAIVGEIMAPIKSKHISYL